jgi:hypothetical protein
MELLVLVLGGSIAIACVAFLHLSLRIPGSAILRSSLPVLISMSLVPRQGAGIVTSLGAAMTAATLMLFEVRVSLPAVVAVIALGPMIDLSTQCWKRISVPVYLGCGLAGVIANSIAYFVKFGLPLSLVESGGHALQLPMLGVFASFILCGFLSGILFSALVFRVSNRVV